MSGVKLSSLKFMNVMFNDVRCVAVADSGAEIGVLSEALAEQLGVDTCGYISVRGIFSDPMHVPLINVTLKSCGEANCDNVGEGIQVVCAVAPLKDVTHDAVLPIDTVIELERLHVLNVMSLEVMSTTVDDCVLGGMARFMNKVKAVEDNENDDDCDNNVMNTDRLHTTVLDNDEMRRAQLGDDSLSVCWEMAKLGKGNFIIDDELLYHIEQVEGQKVCQLCVPKSKRNVVLQMAHESVFSGHLVEKKTRERIRLSFYWPKLRQDMKQYINTCQECQLRSHPKTMDRVPIAPITRAEVPFQVLNIDCISPIDPPSAHGHRYCLCIVDNCTHWPTVYTL